MLLFFWHATICDIINKMKYKHYSAVCCIEDMKKSHTYSSTEILWVYICSKYWLDETRVSLATMSRKPVLAWNLHSTQNFFLILFDHQHNVSEDQKNLGSSNTSTLLDKARCLGAWKPVYYMLALEYMFAIHIYMSNTWK